ncbi:hypothetical protein [Streptomyces sp. bgisy100]|uniref:hypothetical protein n=1 Tax=Streptomyces sp. bgisy100 TaxID=3413783 RepID=UPI003D75BEBB
MRVRGRGRSGAVLASAVVTGALLLTAGCGSGEQKEKTPKTATGTVEQLAKKVTCKPDMQIDAKELRQGLCKSKKARYVLTTFATNKGQMDWLGEAQNYGGSYLVGPKWVAVGEPKTLGKLRGKLGGEVETAPSHGGSHGGGSHEGDSHEGGSHHGSGEGGSHDSHKASEHSGHQASSHHMDMGS